VELGIHNRVSLRDLPHRVDQERVPGCELYQSEIRQRSIRSGHFVVRVGQQLEAQSLFRTKLPVRIDVVEAHSQDDGVAFGVFGLIHLKLVGFARSAWSLVFGIEIENHPSATIVGEANRGAIFRGQGEIWSLASLGGFRRARQQSRDQKQRYDDHQQRQSNLEHGGLPAKA